MSDNVVVSSLWLIAEDAMQHGNVLVAIQSLEALLSDDEDFSTLVQVKTHLRLAEWYLKHTYDVELAKSHLDKALIGCKDLTYDPEIRLTCLYLLAIVYERLGQDSSHKQTLLRGIQSVMIPTCWLQYFLLELVRVEEKCKNYIAALEYVEKGLTNAYSSNQIHVAILFKLVKVQILFKAQDFNQANQLLELTRSELENISQKSETTVMNEDGITLLHLHSPIKSPQSKQQNKDIQAYAMLEVHFKLLEICSLIQSGNFRLANQKLDSFHQVVDNLGKLNETPQFNFYDWMPPAWIYCLTYLLSSILQRPIGNNASSLGFISKGINLIDSILAKELPSSGTYYGVPYNTAQMLNDLVYYKFLLLENSVYIYLSTLQLAKAIQAIELLCTTYDTFSSVSAIPESYGLSTIYLLLGLYAQSVGIFDYGFHYITLSLQKTINKTDKIIIYSFLGLAMLNLDSTHRDMFGESIEDILTHLNSLCQSNEVENSRILKASLLYTRGLIYLSLKDLERSKLLLKECLSFSNGSLSHNHLASAALNALGSLYILEHSYQTNMLAQFVEPSMMLKSSLVLSYKSEDFFNKLYALELLSLVYEAKQDRINQGYNLTYKINAQKKWKTEIQQCLETPLSNYLLAKYVNPVCTETYETKKKNDQIPSNKILSQRNTIFLQ